MVICDKVNKFILHDVDLHIPQGVTLGIIGASRAGKTTFLKLISGLLAYAFWRFSMKYYKSSGT